MSFYTDLSDYYEDVFPITDAMKDFLRPEISGKVLNIGCASGNLERVLAENKTLDLTGIDLNEDMIARARKNAEGITNISFYVENMTTLDTIYPENHFDTILCLGNTLAHLSSLDEIGTFLSSMRFLLKQQGVLIVQIMNYDRIFHDMIMKFEPVKVKSIVFERSYELIDGDLVFNTKISDKISGKEFRNAIILYPVLQTALCELLEKSGFYFTGLYGGYDGSSYSPDSSYHTIVVAR